MNQLLIKLNAWSELREWAEDKTIEQIVEQCHRGDWLLWLAEKVDIGLQPLTLAKGHCVNTVRHLMTDERSVKAVDVAIAFGEGRATREELDDAYHTALAVESAACFDAYAAYLTAVIANELAAVTALWAAEAALWSADDTDAAKAATYAASAAGLAAAASLATDVYTDAEAADEAARAENQKQTADICRKYIGQLIIDKCNELNSNL